MHETLLNEVTSIERIGDLVRGAFYEAYRDLKGGGEDETFEAWLTSQSRKRMLRFIGSGLDETMEGQK